MTDKERKEKYPIGTKIKYIGTRLSRKWGCDTTGDIGKTGKIVGFYNNFPLIFLSESTHTSEFSTQLVHATWETGWDSLEILPQKNQQLLFAFME